MSNRSVSRRRTWSFLIVGFGLGFGYFLLRGADWQGSFQLHSLMEVAATLLAMFIGLMAVVRYYSKQEISFLLIGTGFVGTAFLDGYHAVVTSDFFAHLPPSDLPSLISWSWVASRIFLSVLLFLSWLAWKREERMGPAGRFSESAVYVMVLSMTFASFFFFAFVPLPKAYFQEFLFHRPEEFAPALFFLLALIGYISKGKWQTDSFEFWLVLSLIVGLISQSVFMSSSHQLFDFEFDAAHLLKIVSYLCVLVGLLVNMYATFRDAEESAERIRSTVETVVDAIITIDHRGTIASFNPAAENLFGYPEEEVIGKNVKMLMPEPYASQHDGYLSNYLSTGTQKIFGQVRQLIGKRQNGEEFPIDLAVNEMSIGTDRMFTGVIRDITERVAAERKLNETSSIQQAIFDSAGSAIITTGDNGKILTFNTAAEKILGYRADEVIGKMSPEKFFAAEEIFIRAEELSRELEVDVKADVSVFVAKAREGLRDDHEWTVVRKDGTRIPVLLSLSALKMEEGQISGYIGVLTDNTERHEMDRMMSEFVSTVSHELRTPLTSIRGSLGLLTGGALGEIDGKAGELLSLAEKNTARLINLVNDILDMEKIQSGQMEYQFDDIDVARLTEHAIETNQAYADQFHVNFKNLVMDKQLIVSADWDRLNQVMANLMSNAAKFSSDGDVVEIDAHRIDRAIRISVKDYGQGIPEMFREKIFERFSQVDSSDTRLAGGTGLGLNISKAIIEAHRGVISFETVLGEGSIFYVDLPECGGQTEVAD